MPLRRTRNEAEPVIPADRLRWPLNFNYSAMNLSIGFALTSVLLSQQALSQDLFSAKGSIPIALHEAPKLFEQCSRSAPDPKGKLWLPSRTEEKVLQKRLVAYLKTSGFLQHLRQDAEYRGQYVGFFEKGERKIYAAFNSYSSDLFEAVPGVADIWCDGFNASWGIVYVPRTRIFERFKVNGHI